MANIINFNTDDKDNQQGNQTQSGGQSATITPVSAFNAQQSVPQAQAGQQSASSGQFTNIQKYLQANKGAGQQIAGNVNKQQDKNLQTGRTAQEDATKAFQAGVQSANDVLGRGQGYSQQLQAPVQQTQGIMGSAAAPNAQGQVQQQEAIQPVNAFNPGNIVNDQNMLTDFTKIRLGQGVNEEQLNQQATNAQTLAGSNQTTAQNQFDQTRTATGRNALIGQTFNNPNYTQGQQRLDSLFLTGAGKQGINAVQDKARQNINQANQVYNQATSGVNQAGQIKTQEQQLQQDLQNRANALETGYVSNLEALIPEVNNMRADERARWQNNFDILTGKKQGQIDDNIFNELQLRSGEHAFGVLKDPNLTLQQIAQISERNAAGIQDVARQQDVDYYNMLAKLSKGSLDAQGNFVGPAQDQLKLTQASDLGRAAQALTGDGSLRDRLNQAQNRFFTDALTRQITGHGEDSGSSGLFGGGGTAESNMALNLGDYLKSLGLDGMTGGAPTPGSTNYAQIGANLAGLSNPVNQIGMLAGMADGGPIGSLGSFLSGAGGTIAGGLASSFGLTGSGGSSVAANARARQNLLDNLTTYLKDANFNEYVTQSGRKNADALAQQARDIESARLDARNRNQSYTNPLATQAQQDQYARNEQARQLMNMTGYNASDVKPNYTNEDIAKFTDSYLNYMTNYNTSNGGWYNPGNNQASILIDRMTPEAKEAWRNQLASQVSGLGQQALQNTLASRQATETKYNQQQQANQQALRELLGTKDIQTGAIAESPAMTREEIDRLLAGRK